MGITFTAASPILPSADLAHDGLMQSNGKDLLEDLQPGELADIVATSTSLKKSAKNNGSLKTSASPEEAVTLKKATKDKTTTTTTTTTKTVPFKPEDQAVSSGAPPPCLPSCLPPYPSYLSLLIHPTNSPYQQTLPIHPINTVYQHSPFYF